jgi:hypothetical protein
VGVELLHEDGQAGMAKQIVVAFHNFAKQPKHYNFIRLQQQQQQQQWRYVKNPAMQILV